MTKDDLRQVVGALLELPATDQSEEFQAAVVMAAPIVTRSFQADRIAYIFGLRGAFVREVVKRLRRDGVWSDRNHWRAKWPELFMGYKHYKKLTDETVSLLRVAFVCESLVASGYVVRWDENGDFTYQYAADKFNYGVPGERVLNQLRAIGARRDLRDLPSSAFKQLDLQPGSGVFVDFGCGRSADAKLATGLGYVGVGLDLYLPGPAVRGSIMALPFRSQSVACGVCQAVLDLVPPRARPDVYAELYRVLIPGGRISIYLQRLVNGWGLDAHEERRNAKACGFELDQRGTGFVMNKAPAVRLVKSAARDAA